MSDEGQRSAGTSLGLVERHRRPLVVVLHALLFALALLTAFGLAYNFHNFSDWFKPLFLPMLVLALPFKVAIFWVTGQFRGSWRYVGLRDLFGVISAALIGSFVFLTAYFLLDNAWNALWQMPLIDRPDLRVHLRQAVFPLDWACTVGYVTAARVLVRFYYEDIRTQGASDVGRVFIVGAGDAGEALLRELLRMPKERYHCVGILDDDVPQLHNRIHGVEVLGRTTDIRALCLKHSVQEVLIALQVHNPRAIRKLVERCEGIGVTFRTVPPMTDVIAGKIQVSQIREVDISDLLGRQPVQLDTERIGRQLHDKRVLITGAGGSIGSELCRQVAAFGPKRLILVEQAENSLFEIDRELRAAFPAIDIVPYVADIVDEQRLLAVFNLERPSSVFHSAAHKHVPMMEINPGEAIKNNIGGTRCVANAALAAGVEKMVMISTDKAINPTSVMGCSKRVAEMYVQGMSGMGATQFITVRFGNVLGSSGSVVPIFRDQIAAGGPVTVTHPDMTRYFMMIPEAAQLVLQAGMMGKGGEIYVLHMGEPVKIVDLAKDMIALSGLKPGVDIDIVYSGVRPGEKLFEELSCEGEDIGDTAHPKIGIWKHRAADRQVLIEGIDRLHAMSDTSSNGEIHAALRDLVPEYTPAGLPEQSNS